MSKSAESEVAASPTIHPLKPRRGLFYLLLAITLLWIVAMIVMYFTTVRH